MEMSQMSGVPKLEDDAEAAAAAEEPWPPAMREKERQRRRVLLVAGLMALPLLAFLFLGRDSASMVWEIASAKLNSMNQGWANASHGHGHVHGHGHDELLGGLLAPGMDRPSCRSRYELSSYFKRFPYAPSPYLLGKLRAYEARHRRCAPGTPLYAKAVEQLKSGVSSAADAMECRYVVWLPFDGLGNRMLSMASGFLYALLTGRVLLAAIPPDSADLFCEPFPNTTWRLPAEDFPVANLFSLGPSPDVSLTSLLKSNKIAVDVAPASSNATAAPPVPAYVYLSLGWQMTDGPFFCGEHQVALGKVDWLLLFSDLYFVPSLYQVAEFQPELRRLFPETKESAAHLLLRYLLHPTNPVWDLVTAYYDANLAPAARRISLQIRMFGFASIAAYDYYKQILACSAQEHVLPEPDGGGGNGGGGNGSSNSTTTAIFIASLYPDYYERLTARYAAPNAAAGERVVGVFQRTHEQRQATHNLAHNQRALAEIYLLSFSEELMTSGMSTFGYVSSSLAGVRPAILLPAYNHKVPATPCRRAVSMEPCNLTPPRGVQCHGEAVDKEDFERHVKVCEDREVGVKFFD